MNLKNVKNCALKYGNTYQGTCFNDIGIPRGVIFVSAGKTFDASAIATLKTALAAAILADQASQRAYPLRGIVEITDNTATPTDQTFAGDNSIAVGQDPNYDLTFRWIDGGFCLLYGLRKSNRQTRAALIYDNLGQLIGVDAGGDLIKGIEGYSYSAQFKWSIDSSATAGYNTRFIFSPEQVNENIAIVDFSQDGGLSYFKSLSGLQDVLIAQAAARAAGVLKAKATLRCSGVDLFDVYPLELAAAAAWVATNKATGNPIAITSVVQDAGNRGWTITLNTADANYSATPGAVLIGLAGPTELAALNVTGYESNKLAQ